MSRKNILEPYKMFDAADISVSVDSETVNVKNLDKASIIVEWTGTSPVGTIAVMARNRKVGVTSSWVEVDMGATISVSGNSGSHLLRFDELPFTEIKLSYTSTSGTGSLTAIITGKQVGG